MVSCPGKTPVDGQVAAEARGWSLGGWPVHAAATGRVQLLPQPQAAVSLDIGQIEHIPGTDAAEVPVTVQNKSSSVPLVDVVVTGRPVSCRARSHAWSRGRFFLPLPGERRGVCRPHGCRETAYRGCGGGIRTTGASHHACGGARRTARHAAWRRACFATRCASGTALRANRTQCHAGIAREGSGFHRDPWCAGDDGQRRCAVLGDPCRQVTSRGSSASVRLDEHDE